MFPRVDVDPPDVNVDEDSAYDKFASFVIEHPRPVVVGLLIIMLMILWKKPLFRGIVIGMIALFIVIAIATQ